MPTIPGTRISPPRTWEEFEDITLSAVKLRWNTTDFFRNGRTGQRQNGVDIFGTPYPGHLIGIQCKNTIGGISLATVLKEIKDAGTFRPRLQMLYVVTTAEHDSPLQEEIRHLSEKRLASGEFGVQILFWPDIVSDLGKDLDEVFKHYPYLRPEPETVSPVGGDSQKFFDVNDLAIQRHPVFGGKSVSMLTLRKYGAVLGIVGFGGSIFSIFHPVGQSSWQGWAWPASTMCLIFGMTSVMASAVLKKRKFEHLLLGKFYLEATQRDRLRINKLSAVCPWCKCRMNLWNVGPKDGPKDDLFICERNPKQHRILLDPTCLSELP